MKRTYYLGLSMAGTVSVGTYTAGCLIELDNWLKNWRAAVKANQPVKLVSGVKEKRCGHISLTKKSKMELVFIN